MTWLLALLVAMTGFDFLSHLPEFFARKPIVIWEWFKTRRQWSIFFTLFWGLGFVVALAALVVHLGAS